MPKKKWCNRRTVLRTAATMMPAIAPTTTATPISANSLRRTSTRNRAGRLKRPRSELSVGAVESIDSLGPRHKSQALFP